MRLGKLAEFKLIGESPFDAASSLPYGDEDYNEDRDNEKDNDEESSLRMVLMVRQAVAQRAKSTMLAIHPRLTIHTGKLTKRLSDRDKKEIARFASSRLTLDLPRYLWSLI